MATTEFPFARNLPNCGRPHSLFGGGPVSALTMPEGDPLARRYKWKRRGWRRE
jgi:hypothetical protein